MLLEYSTKIDVDTFIVCKIWCEGVDQRTTKRAGVSKSNYKAVDKIDEAYLFSCIISLTSLT